MFRNESSKRTSIVDGRKDYLAMGLVEEFRERQTNILDTVHELVLRESPSTDKAAVDRLGSYVQERCAQLDADVNVHQQQDYGDLIVASWPGHGEPLMVMTHIDTVWPVGTIKRMPFSVENDLVRGPGVFDMKASIAMMFAAIEYMRDHDRAHRPIHWLINSEEEIGSPISRPLIESMAREVEYVLCLEPPVPLHGALKTARKGVGLFEMIVEGRASHAGVDPAGGVSAIQELANQIQYLHGLTDLDLGTTVNVGTIAGGTRSNVVAARAEAHIDLRVMTSAEAERVVKSILRTRPRLPGSTVTVTGGMNRPPMERTEHIAAAFQRTKEIGAGLGLHLDEASTGGASDGNFTAAVGATTIDGLGCPGDGGHADHEHILVTGLIERTALLTGLLTEL